MSFAGSKQVRFRSTYSSRSPNAARRCASIAMRCATRRRRGSRRLFRGPMAAPPAPSRSTPANMGLVLADDLLGRAMQTIRREVDEALDAFLRIHDDGRQRLGEAMRHAVIGGGKRVRPFLLVTTAEMY